MSINILNTIPTGLLDIAPTELYKILPGPTVIHIQGEKNPPLWISCLLHGNETTGLLTIQTLLKKYAGKTLPRSLMLFFGNVQAASQGRRHLDDQPDYNRIWAGGDKPENKMAQAVLAEVRQTGLFASVDIHNNTGRNPHYSCVAKLDDITLNLARTFSPTTLYFPELPATLTSALSEMTNAITLESGLPGLPDGTAHSLELVDTILKMDVLPTDSTGHADLRVMDIAATIQVPEAASVGFKGDDADILFQDEFDLFNFTEVKAGTIWGWTKADGVAQRLKISLDGRELPDNFFSYEDGKIVNKVPVIPAMITLDKRILKSDCVGYVMRVLDVQQARAS